MEIIEIESEPQFTDIIKANKFVIIDFYAQWCSPCKQMAPKFVELSKKYLTVQFAKVDVDDVTEVADICQVKSLPTFMAFEDGELFDSYIGKDVAELEELIKDLMIDTTD
jgi:thioredoxin 1